MFCNVEDTREGRVLSHYDPVHSSEQGRDKQGAESQTFYARREDQ